MTEVAASTVRRRTSAKAGSRGRWAQAVHRARGATDRDLWGLCAGAATIMVAIGWAVNVIVAVAASIGASIASWQHRDFGRSASRNGSVRDCGRAPSWPSGRQPEETAMVCSAGEARIMMCRASSSSSVRAPRRGSPSSGTRCRRHRRQPAGCLRWRCGACILIIGPS